MADIQTLIERLEKLDGPCRECDWLVYTYDPKADAEIIEPPHYTESIDAAFSFLPDGWYLSMLGGFSVYHCQIRERDGGPNAFEAGLSKIGHAHAIVIAALRARGGV